MQVRPAVLAVVWAVLVAYELVAPREQTDVLRLVSNIIWAVFAAELLAKLLVSGRPWRFLQRSVAVRPRAWS